MKKNLTRIMAALALLFFMAPSMVAWAEDVTFNFASLASDNDWENGTAYTSIEISPITLSALGGGNNGKYYTSDQSWRMYNGGTVRITAADGYSITAVSSDPSQVFTISNGTASLSCTATIKFKEIVVTYSSGSAPATYTVTYNANGGTGTMADENSPYEENDVVSLLSNTFTAPEGMIWDSWEVKDANDNNIAINNGTFTMPASNVTVTAQWVADPNAPQINWVLTSLADLTASDVFVIVGNNGSYYAMSNDKGTSNAPATVVVTATGDKITSTVAANIQWNVSGDATNGYTFYPNGSTSTWLYCNTTAATGSNNNMRVGTGNRKVFEMNSNGYLMTKDDNVVRYLSIYNNSDWRGYINTDLCPEMSFFKKVSGEVLPPSITADNVDIEYDAVSGAISYTINNPVNGGELTAATQSDWLTVGEVGETVPFTCMANEAGTARTATVTLTYTYSRETVTKEVTVTQAAAPVIYTTIPDLFAAATTTETPVLVTFNNWVVSGVSSNGKNIFVTDNNGNGFVIYYNSDMSSTFAAGDILSGTAVSCSLKKYNGFAELLDVTATDLAITSGGTVTVADVAMADLAGVNTGALLHYDNLTCVLTTNSAGTTTYYNLTDGTTTMQVYSAIYAFGTLVEGQTYNITGIYQQYNNTKEILPRSADDIEEVANTEPSITVDPATVEVDAAEHDGTLALTYENLTITSMEDFDVQYYDAEGEEASEPDWIEVLVAEQDPSIGEGYVVSYYMMENEGEARTAYFKVYAMDEEAELVYSNLVTVNQAAPVVPPTPGSWVLTDLADLTEDDVFVIVGTYEDAEHDSYAMSNDNGTSAPTAVEVTVAENTLSEEPAANIQWTLGITDDGYIFYPNGTTETWLYCTNSNNGVKVGTNVANVFQLDAETGYLKHIATSRYVGIYNTQDWRCYTTTTGNIANQSFAFYKKAGEAVTETHTLTIAGYGTSNGGYYLIASPVTVNIADVEGLTSGDFDLYAFNQAAADEWINYEQTDGSHPFTKLEPGKGYLYAHKTGGDFILTGTPYTGDGEIELAYTEGGDFPGWNLVGNPYATTATITTTSGSDKPFYVMNEGGTEVEASDTDQVAAMQGVFVVADGANQTVTFTEATGSTNTSKIVVNVRQNRGNVIDRAIVRFGQGEQLPKFMLNEDNTKIYIPQGTEEYAVVRSNSEGEMPVSFKAAENGTYTLNIAAENTEMEYLHLIDNMTGADIDLLSTPNYTFQANTTDYANRFQLVFNANTSVNELASDRFATFNGSEWMIRNQGEATLQVIDMTGRVLRSETIDGNATLRLDETKGVYVIRLIQNNTVNNQKVVNE